MMLLAFQAKQKNNKEVVLFISDYNETKTNLSDNKKNRLPIYC